MAFDVNDIISQINHNYLAKPYLYEVRIFGGTGFVEDASQEITINCSGINIPGINLGFAGINRYAIGKSKNHPILKSFTELNMTFYETEKEKERNYFVKWMDKIYDKTNRRFNYYRDYVKYMSIIQYNKKGEKTSEWKVLECWPSNISPLDKSYSAGETVPTFNVNMQFNEMNEIALDVVDSPSSSFLGNLFR